MPFAEPECSRGDAVGAVGADDDVCLDRRPRRPGSRSPSATRAPSRTSTPALAGRVEQERVEPPALRHVDHRRTRATLDRRRRSGNAARRDRPPPRRRASDRPGTQKRARGQAAAAGLVAREGRAIGEQHRQPRAWRAGGRWPSPPGRLRRRERRSAARSEATMRRAQGGVPERPKGTGCKPVGSAYGGSNPPAPTSWILRRRRPMSATPDTLRRMRQAGLSKTARRLGTLLLTAGCVAYILWKIDIGETLRVSRTRTSPTSERPQRSRSLPCCR